MSNLDNSGKGKIISIISFLLLFVTIVYADTYLNSRSGSIYLNTSNTARIQITSGGNLVLLGIANATIPGNLSVGSVLFVDYTAGNLGIGTTTPQSLLDVAGAVIAEGTLNATSINSTAIFQNNNQVQTVNAVYNLVNFTSNYDARSDRFGIANGTVLPFSNFQLANGTSLPFSNFQVSNGTALPFSNFIKENLTALGSINLNTTGNLSVNGTVTFFNTLNCDKLNTTNGVVTCSADKTSSDLSVFSLANYSAEYASTGYKLSNFTLDYSGRIAEQFNNQNLTNYIGDNASLLRTSNISGFPFSNFRLENVSNVASSSPWNSSGTNVYTNDTNANVGIGTSNPSALLHLVSNNVTTNNSILQITLNSNNSGDRNALNIIDTANVGNITSGPRTLTVTNQNLSLTPQANLQTSSGRVTLNAYGINNALVLSNVTLGDTSSAVPVFNAFASNIIITGNPTFNDQLGNGNDLLNVVGESIFINSTPLFKGFSVDLNYYGSKIANNFNGGGGSSFGYGTYATATGSGSGDYSYGGYFIANGVGLENNGVVASASGATNNYGVRILAPAAGTTNYSLYSASTAKSYFAGNIGIGTTAPSEKLVLIGNANISGTLNVSGSVALANLVSCTSIQSDANGVLSCGSGSSSSSPWNSSGTNVFLNDSTAKVGIGTSSPNHVLDVNGNLGILNNSYINFGSIDGLTGYGIRDNQGTLQFKNSGSNWSDVADGDLIPAGTVVGYAGATAPAGYLMLDGSIVSRTTYAELFNAIGTLYGAGDGSTTFQLPDMRGRVAVGAGQGSNFTNRSVGQTGGFENTTGIPAQTSPAALGIPDPTEIIARGSGITPYVSNAIVNASIGGPLNDSNLPPYTAVNFLIKTTTKGGLPIGTIAMFQGQNAPNNWLIADGSGISRTDYGDLFTNISTTFGTGDGANTFNIPDFRGRTAVGSGVGSGLTVARSLGFQGGNETTPAIPAENVTSNLPTPSATAALGASSGAIYAQGNINSSLGGSLADSNMPPYIVLNYLILTKNTNRVPDGLILMSAVNGTVNGWNIANGSVEGAPDLRGRIAIGSGKGNLLTNRTLGATGGLENTTAIPATLTNATTGTPSQGVQLAIVIGGNSLYRSAVPNTVLSGASQDGNMPPFVVMNYIIKGPASQQLAIGNTVLKGTPGSLLYVDSGGKLGQNSNSLFLNQNSTLFGINQSNPLQTLDVTGTLKVISGSGTKGLFQDSNANLGIGTTSPAEKLVVIGNVNISGTLNVSGSVALANLASCTSIQTDSNGVLSCGTGTASSSPWNSSGTNVFLNDSTAKVGIGTTSPQYLLQVANATNAVNLSGVLYINGNGNSGNVLIGNGSNGNVGIGTTNPTTARLVISDAYAGDTGIDVRTTQGGDTSRFSVSTGGLVTTFNTLTVNTGGSAVGIAVTGNVGIGTSNPSKILSVNGTLNAVTIDPSATPNPVMNTTGNNMTITSASGSVIIRLG